jgi:hypothetical protein
VNPQPLTDAKLNKLADLLMRFGGKCAMNLEMLWSEETGQVRT